MGFRHDPEFAPLINMFPGQMPTDVTALQKPSKAPVLRLDQYGNAIDEHGNVINMSKPVNLSTLKVNINKQKKEAFQILKPELDVDPESNPHFDERMGINKSKLLRPKRMSFQFVEEGQWSKQAEIIKFKRTRPTSDTYGDGQLRLQHHNHSHGHMTSFHILQVVSDKQLVKHLPKEVARLEVELHTPDPSARSGFRSRTGMNQAGLAESIIQAVCFLRQFIGSVSKTNYTTLRHGFIMAHLAEGSEFNFQNYLKRAMDKELQVVVGISIWI